MDILQTTYSTVFSDRKLTKRLHDGPADNNSLVLVSQNSEIIVIYVNKSVWYGHWKSVALNKRT